MDGSGNGALINLTHEQVRTLVCIYRGGGFARKLEAVGMEIPYKKRDSPVTDKVTGKVFCYEAGHHWTYL